MTIIRNPAVKIHRGLRRIKPLIPQKTQNIKGDDMGRKSTRENKTIYQKLREENDLTREKAAELLEFISEDRLERIENEKSEPAPEDVIRMAEVYKAPELCNYYCSHE